MKEWNPKTNKPPDLSESDSSRPVAVWLLDASSGGGRLASSLGRQLFPGHLIIRQLNLQKLISPWSLASSRLPCGLLGARHDSEQKNES